MFCALSLNTVDSENINSDLLNLVQEIKVDEYIPTREINKAFDLMHEG